MVSIAIVGGGIAGLAAAWQLSNHADGIEVIVLEGSGTAGGKLRSAVVGGQSVDVGAESVLARRPEAVQLLRELGLPTVHPDRVGASIWSRDALHPMPAGTLMGVPGKAADLEGLLTEDELARVADEHSVSIDGDVAIGELIERALGSAVVDRLVEPLLGGVYAGHARELSARACMPALLTAADTGESLTAVARRVSEASAARAGKPVFASIEGGLGQLPPVLVAALQERGVGIRLETPVTEIAAEGSRWRLQTGGPVRDESLTVDAVLCAAPAAPTARLLRGVAPDAAAALAGIDYASMALVTYAFPSAKSAAFSGSSGFLVPPVDGRDIKASTFSSSKWPWLGQARPDLTFVRVSFGRHREVESLQLSDAHLAWGGLADLRRALPGQVPAPVAAHVQRWGGGLPQYAVGHVERIAGVRESLAAYPTLALAGAAYDGVGIPACIGSARAAADQLIAALG